MAKRTCECGNCKKCRHREYMNAWYRRPGSAERVRSWATRYRETNADKVREYDRGRGFREGDRNKIKARYILNRAIERGDIVPPDICDECETPGREFSDGRRSIQAHHDDYAEPCSVRWLCVSCHGKTHRVIV